MNKNKKVDYKAIGAAKRPIDYINWLLIIAAIILPSLPILVPGIHYGHDLVFHLERIEALVFELKQHVFPVFLSRYWMDGYGYPTSIYYGDWALYLPAAVRLMGKSVEKTYKLYLFLTNAGLVLVSYYSCRQIFKRARSAAVVSFLYACASYHFTNLFVRAALGEYTAMVFFPLVIAGLFILYQLDTNAWTGDDYKVARRGTWMLAIGMAAIFTCHILSFFMTCLLIGVFVLLTLRQTFVPARIKWLMIAVVKTVLLSAFFWIPFLTYMKMVDTRVGVFSEPFMRQSDADLEALFDYTRNTYEFYDPLFNKSTGPTLMVVLALAVVTIVVAYIKKSDVAELRSNRAVIVKATLMASITLWMALSYFPWNQICALGKPFSAVAAIQYPWRFFAPAVALLAFLAGLLMEYAPKAAASVVRIISFMLCLTSGMMMLYFAADYKQNALIERYFTTEAVGSTQLCAGEYVLEGSAWLEANHKIYKRGVKEARFEEINGRDSIYYARVGEKRAGKTDFRVDGERTTSDAKINASSHTIDVPIYNYPYYTARDVDERPLTISNGQDNRIRIHLPDTFEGNIYIKFCPPIWWNLGYVISLLTVLYGLFYTDIICNLLKKRKAR